MLPFIYQFQNNELNSSYPSYVQLDLFQLMEIILIDVQMSHLYIVRSSNWLLSLFHITI